MGEDREERERDLKTEAIVFLSLSLRGDILSLPPYSIHSSTIFYPFFHHILSSEAGEEIQPHSRRGTNCACITQVSPRKSRAPGSHQGPFRGEEGFQSQRRRLDNRSRVGDDTAMSQGMWAASRSWKSQGLVL